jgi:GH25 family lysozyme M1 (1,4-beta-N-acetylmuramidase)
MVMTAVVSTNGSRLNVRPAPSLDQPPIGELAYGQSVTVVGTAGGWYQIEDGALRGYVAAQYLTIAGAAAEATTAAITGAANDALFMPDLYSGDANGAPNWTPGTGDPRYVGAIIKATEGQSFPEVSWFLRQWPALREAGGDGYGVRWFRGCYHYLVFHDDPRLQADLFLRSLRAAGGLDPRDLPPVVDVERGGQKSPNRRASAQQVIDVTSKWVEIVGAALGRKVMLYGLGAMRDLGIRDRMGCAYLWAPHYWRALEDDRLRLTDIGWSCDALRFWQYTDGQVNLTRYPHEVPGIGPCDTSVFTGGGIGPLAAFVAESHA